MEFVNFMAYAMPLVVIVNTLLLYLTLQITHMGLCQPNSDAAKQLAQGEAQKGAVQKMIEEAYTGLGPITCHEIQVALAFILMITLLITRNPGFFPGWATFLNAK